MALPDTISGVDFAPNLHLGGPFEFSGNYYFVARDSTDASRVEVWKSTNPGTAAWAEQAGDAGTSGYSTIRSISAVKSGTDIHILTGGESSGTGNVFYRYYVFSTLSDSFTTTEESCETISTNPPGTTEVAASLAVRSDGEVVALIVDIGEKVHGVTYTRVSYLNRTSGTWDGTPTAVGGTGVATNFTLPRSVLGASNKVHFTYYDGSNIQHKSLSSGDSLSSAEAVNDTTPTDGNSRLAYLNDGSNDLVMTAWIKDSDDKVYTSLITDDGTPAAEGATSDAVIWVVSNTFSLTADDTNDKFYAAWSGTANDLFHDEYDAGWGTDVETWDAVTISAIGGANVYQNDAGDTVLAYVVDNGGTIQYNEYTLVAGAAGSFPPRLRPLRMLRR